MRRLCRKIYQPDLLLRILLNKRFFSYLQKFLSMIEIINFEHVKNNMEEKMNPYQLHWRKLLSMQTIF